jgi:hypothetical protein
MLQSHGYKQFQTDYPQTTLSLVDRHGTTQIYSKTLFFEYQANKPDNNTGLRQQAIEAYLLFLHNLASQKNRESTINVTAVQHSLNPSLLTFKQEALSEAIIAYKTVNSEIHFTIDGKIPTATLQPTPKTIAFCEELKKPVITPSPSARK